MAVAKITFLDLDAWQAGGGIPGLLNWKALILGALLLFLTRGVKSLKKLHPIVFIAASAAVGIVFAF